MSSSYRLLRLALIPATLMALGGCGDDGPVVHRTDTNAVRDLSGGWNATDVQTASQDLVAQALAKPWADDFRAQHGGAKPVVKVGRIYVQVPETIDTNILTDRLTQALIDSGKVRVVAANTENDQARDERKQQDVQASDATRHESFQELGADFLLIGTITSADDQAGNQQQKFYVITIKLTDVKTQELISSWTHRIAKDVTRPDYK